MEYNIPVDSIITCKVDYLTSFTEGKRYVVLASNFGNVTVRDDNEVGHILTSNFIFEHFEVCTGVLLDLSPMKAKKLSDILKSARMLHTGNEKVIDEVLGKLKRRGVE